MNQRYVWRMWFKYFVGEGSSLFKHVGLALILLMSGSHFAAAETNQRLSDILVTNPVAEINKLTKNMAAVLPDLPTSPLQTMWNAGVDSKGWDEVRVELLVSQIRAAETTLTEVKEYSQQYAYVFKHRSDNVNNAKKWLMYVGGAIFQMKKMGKLFEQRMRYLKKTLPNVIKSTASLYNNANDTDKTVLKFRLQVQLQCYQMLDFPVDAEIHSIQSGYLL